MGKDDTVEIIKELDKRIQRMMKDPLESSTLFEFLYDAERKELVPLTQINETYDEVIVKFDLPCVRKEDIFLKCTDDVLTVKARMMKSCKLTPLHSNKELEFERFRKSIRLPVLVNANNSKAAFKNGVLEIRLQKKSHQNEVIMQ
ncbi:MAG TPA: Hsp20/alpha crystallin family protein [Nitrososphaerales archaeon]|jgi:HSP20 family protein|nr:Hsp20/alpha crystallin family protein [Nitrososphaerales archaeon]